AGGGVAPQEVGGAVTIDVAGADDLPGSRYVGENLGATVQVAIADEPGVDLAGGGVAPEYVADGVAVEVIGRRRFEMNEHTTCTVGGDREHRMGDRSGQRDLRKTSAAVGQRQGAGGIADTSGVDRGDIERVALPEAGDRASKLSYIVDLRC